MITQFVEEVPAGKSHPDFSRKPIALTIQEGREQHLNQTITDSNGQRIMTSRFLLTGKFAFFKAIITGDPTPTVTWARNNGDVSDPKRYIVSYDKISGEHQFQVL